VLQGNLTYAIAGWVCAAICLVLAVLFTIWVRCLQPSTTLLHLHAQTPAPCAGA
jgi:hypothetical protein